MTIFVTEEDISKGISRSCEFCPIANAIQRQTPWKYAVVLLSSVFECESKRADLDGRVDLPESACGFIRDFDADRSVSPFSFEIDIPSATK